MRRIVSFLLVLGAMINVLAMSTMAVQPQVKLALKLDGMIQAGNTVTAELWCEEAPGLGSLQFTLDYDRTVLKCTSCKVGPVLRGMMNAVNPGHEDGAIVVGASATAVESTGLVASFVFEVLSEGEPAFRIVNAGFGTETGEALDYAVSGLEQGSTEQSDSQPQKPESPEIPQTPSIAPDSSGTVDDTGDSGGGVSIPSQTPDVPEQPATSETEEAKPAFTDIEGHWAEKYLVIAKERGLVAGYPDGRCGPDDQVTRAQFVMILWKNAGWPEPAKASDFVDLEPGEYYLDAVAWAQEKGYVAGKGEGRFAPNDPVSREEIAVILRKLPASKSGMEQMFGSMYDDHFADSEKTSSWGRNAVYWAVYNEVWCGKADIKMGNELKATNHASRAEVAVMVVNYQDKVEGET